MGLFDFKKSIAASGILAGGTDRSAHLLPCPGSGVPCVDESLRCLHFYEHCGLSDLWLTPRISAENPVSTASLKECFDELVSAYVEEEDSLSGKVRLHLSAEYMLDGEFSDRLAARDILSMENRTVLVTVPEKLRFDEVEEFLARMSAGGYRPLLSVAGHDSRLSIDELERFRSDGIRIIADLGTLLGNHGASSRRKARAMIDRGLCSCIGSGCGGFEELVSDCSRKEFTKDMTAAISGLLHA